MEEQNIQDSMQNCEISLSNMQELDKIINEFQKNMQNIGFQV